jgi:S1-C subfamily serine protease
VISSTGSVPVSYARVTREARGGGASAQPSNAGTVTRTDGTFELTGIPAGAVSITVAADHFHPRIVAGMTATDGDELPDAEIELTPLQDGELPLLELVGIGVALAPDGDALRVTRVIGGSGAQAAGIVVGDEVVAVDGDTTADLGIDGAVAKIRGTEGTTVAIGLRRSGEVVTLAVERRKLKA